MDGAGSTCDSAKKGRPRDPEVEKRILDITLAQMARDGYSRMSLDSVAAEAGVSKPTIYRRWTGKADLATAALRTLQIAEQSVDTGSTRGDLIGILRNFRRSLLRPNGMSLIGAVLAEENHTPELLAFFRDRIVAPRRHTLRVVLETAKQRHELRHGVDIEAVVVMLVGAFYAQYLAQPKVPADYPERLVQTLWSGIARAP
jgi:AcrR family transcriptional regulator